MHTGCAIALLPYVNSSALVIFTEDCTGRPQKTTGEEEIISKVSIAELDDLRAGLTDATPWLGEAVLAGRPRAALALRHTASQSLLVLTDPAPAVSGEGNRVGCGQLPLGHRCAADPGKSDRCPAGIFGGIPRGLGGAGPCDSGTHGSAFDDAGDAACSVALIRLGRRRGPVQP